jgi:hypothetical protein
MYLSCITDLPGAHRQPTGAFTTIGAFADFYRASQRLLLIGLRDSRYNLIFFL